MPVDTPRQDYLDTKPVWRRLRDTYNGRDAVLKAGAIYVPDLKGLESGANKNYRARGNFYNCVKRTVHGLTGLLYQKAPEVEFPKSEADFLTDVTLTNITFEMFAVEAGREAMLMGRFGILVDMPTEGSEYNRPYLCSYKAEDIVNWRTERINGDTILQKVVLREKVEVVDPKDEFKIDTVDQYRVCEVVNQIYTQKLYRYQAKEGSTGKEWVQYGETLTPVRRGTTLNFIPFVFMGAQHATAEITDPPLTDLADVNLAHWRNSVDYEYGLHLVALPTPWIAGGKNSSSDGQMKIGPSTVWELELQGSAGMLEFSGAGLKSIVDAMQEKKKQMAVIGARMLEDVPIVDETATAVVIRRSGENANLRTVANAVEQALTFVLQIVVWWQTPTLNTPNDAPASVELNKEFFNVKISASDVTAALAALQDGSMSFETWWNLLTTGGWGREGVDAKEEKAEIKKDLLERPAPAPTPSPTPELKLPTTKKKTVKDATGKVKYEIEETE